MLYMKKQNPKKKEGKKPKKNEASKKEKSVKQIVKSEIMKDKKKNTELKRRTTLPATGYTVGQVNGNSSGYVGIAFQHSIPQGVGYGDRIGREVTLKGISIRFSLQQQSGLTSNTKYRFEVWKSSNYYSNPDNFVNDVYESDSLSGFIDGNSTRNLHFKNLYKRIYSKELYLKPDTFSGVLMLNNYKIFIKQNQKLEWVSATTAPEDNIFYYGVLLAYQGNKGGTASTVGNIPLTAANTGAIVTMVEDIYFSDM